MDTEQLICHTRDVIVDTLASLHGSDRQVISVSAVHELLTKIHDILDSAESKWIGNTAQI